jgi:MFS transporter, GlpU family, inner membrane protein
MARCDQSNPNLLVTDSSSSVTGIVSVVGYTPDIFVAPVGGWLLDRSPGVPGHRHYYLFLGAFALLGLLATAIFRRLIPTKTERR